MISKDKKIKVWTRFFICRTISKMAKKWPTPISVPYFLFLSEFFPFHIWIASIKLLLKFVYELCRTKVNQDGRRNGRHLLVCNYRHSTLVIYYPIAAKFHIYITFIKLSPKFEYWLCLITKMTAKWPPPVSLHLWTLLRCMSGLRYFKVFSEWVTMECFMTVSKSE